GPLFGIQSSRLLPYGLQWELLGCHSGARPTWSTDPLGGGRSWTLPHPSRRLRHSPNRCRSPAGLEALGAPSGTEGGRCRRNLGRSGLCPPWRDPLLGSHDGCPALRSAWLFVVARSSGT